jgi:hypothetical protein
MVQQLHIALLHTKQTPPVLNPDIHSPTETSRPIVTTQEMHNFQPSNQQHPAHYHGASCSVRLIIPNMTHPSREAGVVIQRGKSKLTSNSPMSQPQQS